MAEEETQPPQNTVENPPIYNPQEDVPPPEEDYKKYSYKIWSNMLRDMKMLLYDCDYI